MARTPFTDARQQIVVVGDKIAVAMLDPYEETAQLVITVATATTDRQVSFQGPYGEAQAFCENVVKLP